MFGFAFSRLDWIYLSNAARKSIRWTFPKQVSNVRAWSDFNSAATLPNSKRHFEIITAPAKRINSNSLLKVECVDANCNTYQIFICSSYDPISKKYSRSIENKPPAIAGDGNGRVISAFRLANSMELIKYHLVKKRSDYSSVSINWNTIGCNGLTWNAIANWMRPNVVRSFWYSRN